MLASALHGVRVVDLSRILAGPWCTQNLADLGADVLKIERPVQGDDTRAWGPPFVTAESGEKVAAYFLSCNRGKRSVTADFAQAADRDWLLRRQVPHPFGMYRAPLHYDAALLAALPRLFIDCTQPAYPTIDAMRERVRTQPGWQVVEMATGHCPMVTQPDALAAHLLAFAQR